MSAPAPAMHSPAACELAKALGLRLGRANLEEFAATLLSLAKEDRDVLAVTSDSRGSGKLGSFATALPEQIVELGIAEQNLVGVSAGLASTGKKVFAVSPASFLTARSLEQIKNDVAYSNHPVKLIGISAGVSYGALGSTHHSLHDLAALRAIHNVEIVVPADNFETRSAILAAASHPRPIYLRFGKAPMYDLHEGMRGEGAHPNPPREHRARKTEGTTGSSPSSGTPGEGRGGGQYGISTPPFEIGRAITLRQGRDLAFIATGETVIHALLAAEVLKKQGLTCRVISMHTIKPLDVDAVLRAGRECGQIITVEEHSIAGGLGEACAAALLQAGVSVPFRIVAIPDEETITGSQADIFRHYEITMEGLGKTAMILSGKCK